MVVVQSTKAHRSALNPVWIPPTGKLPGTPRAIAASDDGHYMFAWFFARADLDSLLGPC